MKMDGLYILDEDGNPVAVDDVEVWAKWYHEHPRRLANNELRDAEGNMVRVSTVFLGLDHSYFGLHVLWETCLFNHSHTTKLDGILLMSCHPSEVVARYHSRGDALTGHNEWVRKVESGETWFEEDVLCQVGEGSD